jgi:hypothetical protein
MRKLVVAVVALLVVVGGGYLLFVTLYSPERQRAELEQRLSQAFGRPAHVGPMRLTFRGGLGVEARDVRVDRDPSYGDGALLEIGRVSAGVGVWDYVVRRQSAIQSLALESPRITLVKREDGVWNWSTLGKPGAAASASASAGGGPVLGAAIFLAALPTDPNRVTPSHITATNAEVVLVNRTVTPATETPYRGLALDTNVETHDGVYRLQGRVSGDSGAAGGEPLATDVTFDLTLNPPGDVPVWRAAGNIPSGKLATRNVRLDSVSTDVALDDRQLLRLEPFALGLYGGAIDGKFALDLSTPNNKFSVSGEAKNVSLGDALAPRPDLAGSLKGQASGTFQLGGELGDFNSTLASLAGDGHIALDGAQLASVNLLSEITRQGGFQQMSFDEQGTRADRIEADLHVESGRFSFAKASVTGINGYANLRGDSGWIDIKSPASVHLEGAATLLPPLLEKIAQANPAAGAIIQFAASRPNFSIPLTLDGPITKPAVTVHWTAVAGLPF